MKSIRLDNLRKCPVCGFSAVLRKNASKRFQIHCVKCKCCTPWTSKTEAVITWYNNADFYEAKFGTVEQRKQTQEIPLEE